MTILRENLIIALREAIRVEQQAEKILGYTGDSAMLAGWKSVLEELKEGKEVIIK